MSSFFGIENVNPSKEKRVVLTFALESVSWLVGLNPFSGEIVFAIVESDRRRAPVLHLARLALTLSFLRHIHATFVLWLLPHRWSLHIQLCISHETNSSNAYLEWSFGSVAEVFSRVSTRQKYLRVFAWTVTPRDARLESVKGIFQAVMCWIQILGHTPTVGKPYAVFKWFTLAVTAANPGIRVLSPIVHVLSHITGNLPKLSARVWVVQLPERRRI